MGLKRKMVKSKKKNMRERAVEFAGIAFLVFVFCSCLSFDIGDWPSRFVYPHNRPAENWCGPIGAFCAYYLMYYIGPGVFVLLISGVCFLLAKLKDYAVDQCFLRIVGLVLLTAAASSSFYFFLPQSIYAFPNGSGGVLGVGLTEFLESRFALLGSFILIGSSWLVGAVLLADRLLMTLGSRLWLVLKKTGGLFAPALSAAKQRSENLGEIWRKLSARQKQQPALPEMLHIDRDRKLEANFKNVFQTVEDEKNQRPLMVKSHQQAQRQKGFVPKSYEDYILPPLDLLDEAEYSFTSVQDKVVKSKASALERLLKEFNIQAQVVAADTGPVVTMFELALAAGIKVSQISTLSNDMARALGAGAVRVVAPLPGKHTIGIEVPNSEKEKVRIKDLMQLASNRPERMQIALFLGKDSSGDALVSDLTKMPHLLIAGTTGSGKSVCINSIVTGILLTKRPDEVKVILIDPKMVEMTAFNLIPHLMCPIVTETRRAVQILEWATVKMDERYSLLAEARVKNVAQYNRLGSEQIIERFRPSSPEEEAKIPKRLPYIVIVIDELADLMMTAGKEIEAYIVRLAQKSRAIGIHLIIATQRPQATVVTGLIKSNMPTRIAFRVAARMDSRIILDQNGAETLLGEGDMLFLKPGTSDLVRAQGSFVDEAEIKRIVKHLKQIAEPQFHPELTQLKTVDTCEVQNDELFDEAVRVVLQTRRGSVSLLQRRLNIGYARASRMIEGMAACGVLGEYKGSQARQVMMTVEEYENFLRQQDTEQPNDKNPAETSYLSEGQRGYVSVDSQTN